MTSIAVVTSNYLDNETIKVVGTKLVIDDKTKIPLEKIGVASGVASLDQEGKVPAAQIPNIPRTLYSFATRLNFPLTGAADVLYLDLSTNRAWTWITNVYVPLNPGTTDNVSEGATNKYFTNARARAAISVTGPGLSYDPETGQLNMFIAGGSF